MTLRSQSENSVKNPERERQWSAKYPERQTKAKSSRIRESGKLILLFNLFRSLLDDSLHISTAVNIYAISIRVFLNDRTSIVGRPVVNTANTVAEPRAAPWHFQPFLHSLHVTI